MEPRSEQELADIVRAAAASGAPLAIVGGGTREPVGACPGARLSTTGLSGVRLYEPGALTLVVGAGTPVAEVEALLASEGQQLPFEPWDARPLTGAGGTPTIGGAVATNASGPRRIVAGACRDSMIGVRFVDGTGAIVKNGGRVMKNVTGLDLVKLLAGSYGTLGILTEIAFRVLPLPEATATLVFEGFDPETAGAAMRAALATPYGVSGAAHDGTRTLLRLKGFAASVQHRSRALAARLGHFGTPVVEEGPGPWIAIRDATALAGEDGAIWRVSVKPTDGPVLGARLGDLPVLYDWAGGLLTVRAPDDRDVRAAMTGIAGHARLLRAGEPALARWGRFHPEPRAVAALASGLRARFDPAGILNRGLMAPFAERAA